MLADPAFRLVWYVGGVGEFSRRMELLALSWLILQITDSYFQLGLVLFFNNAGRPIVSLFTGDIADRFSRKKVMLAGQTINVLTAAGLLSVMVIDFEMIEPWHVFGAVFIQGITKTIEDPSRRTAIIDIVGAPRLVNAVSLDVFTNNAGKMLGPIAAGILLATAGFSGAYFFLIGAHFANLALMSRLRIPKPSGQLMVEPVWRSLGTAISYAWKTPVLVGLLCTTLVMNALAFPMQQFVPAIGQDQLGVGVTLVGLLVAADGFGQLAGSGMMALTRNVRHHGRYLAFGCALFLLVGMAFAWSPWYGLTFFLLMLIGLGQSVFSTMQTSITLLAAPQGMRGRMLGLNNVFVGIGTPVGALEISAVAASFGLLPAISSNALAGLVLMLPVMAFTPLIWRPLALSPTAPPPRRTIV